MDDARGEAALTDVEAPARQPLACGALGSYDEAVVRRIAAALDPLVRTVHADERSLLCLDRPPLEWAHDGVRGVCWSEGLLRPARPRSWMESASAFAACGLVVEGSRRYVHSSVAGLYPIYYLSRDGATYFASRIDPLVAACHGPLSIDWGAWAAIFCLGHPLAADTPFAEVRALSPFSTLEQPRGGDQPAVSSPPWPWAEVEPRLSAREGAGDLVERMRSIVELVPGPRANCMLSGGWDSRLLLCLLREKGDLDLRAFATSRHLREREEVAFATRVASALGVPLTVERYDPGAFRDELRDRSLLADYQWIQHPWLSALTARLRSEPGVVTTGHCLDALMQAGHRYLRADTVKPGAAAIEALWARIRGDRMAGTGRLGAGFDALARERFFGEAESLSGHPAQALLTLYRTRVVRGLAPLVVSHLGASLPAVTPCADHDVACAALSVTPRAKLGASLYRSVFEIVNPEVGGLPSTNDPRRFRLPYPRLRRRYPAAGLREYTRLARESPLRPYVGARADRVLVRDWPLIRAPGGGALLNSLAVFGLWVERYRDRLPTVDPGDALGLEARAATRERA